MKDIKVIVYVSNKLNTPRYQLEVNLGNLVILEHCSSIEKAENVLKNSISELIVELASESIPSFLKEENYTFSYFYDFPSFMETYSSLVAFVDLESVGLTPIEVNEIAESKQSKEVSQAKILEIESAIHKLGAELQSVKLEA